MPRPALKPAGGAGKQGRHAGDNPGDPVIDGFCRATATLRTGMSSPLQGAQAAHRGQPAPATVGQGMAGQLTASRSHR